MPDGAGGRYVALLRGINVGGANKVRMADLRALVESLGHTAVATYINSGNVVFTNGTPELSGPALEAAIEGRIEAELGKQIAVLVRSSAELAAALSANPFPDAEPPRLLLTFLRDEPPAEVLDRAAAIESGDDAFTVLGTTLYLHCPDGIGRSPLAAELSKRRTGVSTARNLATVRKLLEMSQDP